MFAEAEIESKWFEITMFVDKVALNSNFTREVKIVNTVYRIISIVTEIGLHDFRFLICNSLLTKKPNITTTNPLNFNHYNTCQ